MIPGQWKHQTDIMEYVLLPIHNTMQSLHQSASNSYLQEQYGGLDGDVSLEPLPLPRYQTFPWQFVFIFEFFNRCCVLRGGHFVET